jgi:hypothetical protein
MIQEDKKNNPYSPRNFAKSALKELALYAFMAISFVITIFIALELRSWWPFAGWLAASMAFGLWLGQ